MQIFKLHESSLRARDVHDERGAQFGMWHKATRRMHGSYIKPGSWDLQPRAHVASSTGNARSGDGILIDTGDMSEGATLRDITSPSTGR